MRLTPIIPAKTVTRGHCTLKFDVTPEGFTRNVEALTCTDPIFKNTSIATLRLWRYYPKKIDGQAVAQTGLTEDIKFILSDGKGNRL